MAIYDGAFSGDLTPQKGGGDDVSGWALGFTLFAATMMIISGGFQMLQGVVALFEDDFFVLGRQYVFDVDVSTWGWVHAVAGGIVMLAGACLLWGAKWAKAVAIVAAAVSTLINFTYIPYYPIWSLVIIALNIAVIWAVSSTWGIDSEE